MSTKMKAPKVDGEKSSRGTTPEREEKSLRTILNSRMENSSAHGVPNIQRSSGLVTKLAWSLIFLAGIGVMIWQVVTIFQAYYEWNYSVIIEVKFNRTQSFPAITLCNANPMRKSKLKTKNASFQETFDVNYVPSMPDLPEQQPQPDVPDLDIPDLPDQQPLPDTPGKTRTFPTCPTCSPYLTCQHPLPDMPSKTWTFLTCLTSSPYLTCPVRLGHSLPAQPALAPTCPVGLGHYRPADQQPLPDMPGKTIGHSRPARPALAPT
eukprot:XP_011674126.1 PREDICTED: uncharacterized protein LOC105443034 [Strongylocentrotus purpuratus]